MSIQYKTDILGLLKESGYTTYRLRKERLLGEATIQRIRNHELVSWENISTICELTQCQPGDILEYMDKESETNSEFRGGIKRGGK